MVVVNCLCGYAKAVVNSGLHLHNCTPGFSDQLCMYNILHGVGSRCRFIFCALQSIDTNIIGTTYGIKFRKRLIWCDLLCMQLLHCICIMSALFWESPLVCKTHFIVEISVKFVLPQESSFQLSSNSQLFFSFFYCFNLGSVCCHIQNHLKLNSNCPFLGSIPKLVRCSDWRKPLDLLFTLLIG